MKIKYSENEITDLLLLVEKPGRYSGGERNQTLKDAEFVFGICYPDLYEIGMSNGGVKIIYESLNTLDNISCERVFCPAPDMTDELYNRKMKLFTLENRIPLSEIDMLGFNYSHELLATNILHVLKTGGIPLLSAERGEDHPLVMIGGECTSNPGPVAPFADIIFIGEGDDSVRKIVSDVFSMKKQGKKRGEILEILQTFEGCFIPSLARKYTSPEGFVCYEGDKIKKVFSRSKLAYPSRPPVAIIKASQEKAVIEIARGCKNMCNFCHAGFCTLPYREYSPEEIFESVKNLVKNTGYNEITLSALSVSDYSKIDKLINISMPYFNENGLSVSLPSMKVDKTNLPLIKAVSDVRHSSITFAVEAADDMMRRRIHKKLSMNDLYEIIDVVFSSGWNLIKLYFMIGLPGYKDCDEAESIILALNKINEIGRKRKKINVTISPFIPKPHTPFERERTADENYLRETVQRVKKSLPRNIQIKAHFPFGSVLESLISRGDEKIAAVILDAFDRGAVMDSWDEYFREDIWKDLFAENETLFAKYLDARTGELPWKKIFCTEDRLLEKKSSELMDAEKLSAKKRELSIDSDKIREAFSKFEERYNTVSILRFVMEKTGRSKFVSHNDMLDNVRRALRSADLPVSFSQGFNKREKISASFPMPLGYESRFEVIDMEMFREADPQECVDKLNQALPSGMFFSSAKKTNGGNLMVPGSLVTYEIYGADNAGIARKLTEGFTFTKENDKGVKQIESFSAVRSFETGKDDVLILVLVSGTPESMRIDNVLKQLGEPVSRLKIVKTMQIYPGKDGKMNNML